MKTFFRSENKGYENYKESFLQAFEIENIKKAVELGLLEKEAIEIVERFIEEEGYITREVNPENRRKNQIFITPKGKELTEKIIKYNLEWEEQMGFKDLNPIFFKELHKLSRYCKTSLGEGVFGKVNVNPVGPFVNVKIKNGTIKMYVFMIFF